MYRPPSPPLRKNRRSGPFSEGVGGGVSLRADPLNLVYRLYPHYMRYVGRLHRRLGWCVHRLTLKWQSAQGTDTYLAGFCERQGLVRLDCKPLRWKMSPQGIGRRRKSSLRSCQYSRHTLDHTGKMTILWHEISQSFAPSCKYHSLFFRQKISKRTEIFLFLHLTFYLAMLSDVRFQFSWACKDSLFIYIFWQPCILL